MLPRAFGLEDHIGDDRIALHVDARGPAPDQFNAFDLAGRGAGQDIGAGVVLRGRAGSVDQHIAHRALKSAAARAVVDRETGDPIDHVQRGVGLLLGEEVGREDQNARTGRVRGRGAGCHRRGPGGGGLGQGCAPAEQDRRRRQQQGFGHRGFPLIERRQV